MKKVIWTLDKAHSELLFKVKHLMITSVTGHFNEFDATVETEGDEIAGAKVHFSANVDSIFTNNDQRDAHLKNGDFFDAANHPKIIFEGDGLEKTGDETYQLQGLLTMRGTTKRVKFDVEIGGIITDPWGNQRAGFSVSGKIKRSDFGVSFGLGADAAKVLLSDEVKINASAQFIRQVETAKKPVEDTALS